MITQLNGYITQNQIDAILDTIMKQYADYTRLIHSNSFKSLFLEEYAPHNKQFSVSWAISSGFPSGSEVSGLQSELLTYSKNFTRPLLKNEQVEILILNQTTHFGASYLQPFYSLNAGSSTKRFCYFRFCVNNQQLTRISLCYPNQVGFVVKEQVLLERSQIKLRTIA